jgi:Putative auto-transporter adhesin, head GIN domain
MGGNPMNTRTILIPVFIIALLLTSCNAIPFVGDRLITPSDVIISENRDVSGYHTIDFSTWGKVNIITGDVESLNISGPDNILPEINTTVRNGTLLIETKRGITINPLNNNNVLTYTIVVKELTSLKVSGAGEVQVETLSTPSMSIDMSGAGSITQNQITTENLEIKLSGVGGINITGQASQAKIDISGVGSVEAPDMEIGTAEVTLSGLGGTTLWVTDQLTGNISGAGTVSYYGSPELDTDSSGLGSFKALGNK